MLSAGERPQPAIGKNAAAARAKSSLSHSTTPMWSVQPKPEQVQHIWVVTGPAGCGKSTVGRGLQAALNVPFLEGDDFHSQKNKEKMGSGIPLTDADRWDWLISLRNAAIKALSPSEANNFHPPSGVVVACSALKQKYRDVMRVAAYGSPSVQIHFVYLKLDENALLQRVAARQAHYMKSTMVQSQLQDLEEPQGEWDALTIDAHVPQEQVMREVLEAVRDKLAEYQ
ncbi:P-loop containing nucleoside triphosphate hydrolase protein [Aspergillus caelatus]|uniref:Gluconokinase n=2 Tax=Aspergillus subgen. Circumdati TaxID=2720871 RepID=A0A5N6ZMJ4_9EURO|nr:P-loop containing nucleoside triphosphate hydrolase protein [Aspergillus caelatus]KAE8358049.1 P-loop containing nucleoside triphosphate hydrolase protein [Aspergillus caelatus]KAE8413409.1 P-loop containing nucleoside triphosphate hydrolase protein [Aspergillus pseudocaelatus]